MIKKEFCVRAKTDSAGRPQIKKISRIFLWADQKGILGQLSLF